MCGVLFYIKSPELLFCSYLPLFLRLYHVITASWFDPVLTTFFKHVQSSIATLYKCLLRLPINLERSENVAWCDRGITNNLNYEGDSINSATKAISFETTCAIFKNDTQLKRSNSCGYSDILQRENHTFLRRVNRPQ